jgi:hypothetical protein
MQELHKAHLCRKGRPGAVTRLSKLDDTRVTNAIRKGLKIAPIFIERIGVAHRDRVGRQPVLKTVGRGRRGG